LTYIININSIFILLYNEVQYIMYTYMDEW